MEMPELVLEARKISEEIFRSVEPKEACIFASRESTGIAHCNVIGRRGS